jgi:hypothetical protein
MSHQRLQLTAVLAWFAVMTVVASIAALLGRPVTPGTVFLFLTATVLPPAVWLVVFRGAPPRSINQVLYDEEQAPARVPRLPTRRAGGDRS